MGCSGSISEPCGDGPQPELEPEWDLAEPVGWSGGVPSSTGELARGRKPLLEEVIFFPALDVLSSVCSCCQYWIYWKLTRVQGIR